MSYSEPLINQPKVLFFSLGVGMLLCAVYVVVQGLSRLFGDGKLSYFLADGIFCVIFSLVSFFFMVLYNNGRVRLHLILGEWAGFFLFYFSVGRYLLRAFEKGAELLRKAFFVFVRPYAIVFATFFGGMKDFFLYVKDKIYNRKVKNNAEEENAHKKKKKINIFSKIHLKNPDKSV